MGKGLKKCAVCGAERHDLMPMIEMKNGREIPLCLLCVKNIIAGFLLVRPGQKQKLAEGEKK